MNSTDNEHRSGFVAVIGRPNVGKSTLLNALLGQVVHAVSSKPQTTQTRQLGILTLSDSQLVFVDTPGVHDPHDRLGTRMNQVAAQVLSDSDVVLAIFDASVSLEPDDERVISLLTQLDSDHPIVIALNKSDAVSHPAISEARGRLQAMLPQASSTLAVSAVQGDGLQELRAALVELLPIGPRYYEPDTITDRYERDVAADLIRAAAMELLRDELPHSIVVRIDEYRERGNEGARIQATLFVERNSQKGIVIGRGGQMIREIGSRARQAIEAMSGRSVYLDLRVKVAPGWRNDEQALRQFGFYNPGKPQRA